MSDAKITCNYVQARALISRKEHYSHPYNRLKTA